MTLQVIRISKHDGSEEPADMERALRLLRDSYPGNSDDQIIEWLNKGMKLQTDFAIYKAVK